MSASGPKAESDATEASGRVDITPRRTVEEWGIRWFGTEGVEVIRRERVITPDRVTGWRTVPPLRPKGRYSHDSSRRGHHPLP